MSKILKVSQGDYRIQVPTGNSITLDTGTTGSVIITGDLDIKGQTTTIESVNATVSDNILVLNIGEPHTNGTGITLGSSGIQIDRGRDGNVILSTRIVYDESVNHYNPISTNTDLEHMYFRPFEILQQLLQVYKYHQLNLVQFQATALTQTALLLI